MAVDLLITAFLLINTFYWLFFSFSDKMIVEGFLCQQFWFRLSHA